MSLLRSFLLMFLLLASLPAAQSLRLQGPLTTRLPVPGSSGVILEAELRVPQTAPPDLGVGAYLTDREGTWYQQLYQQRLAPGRHHLRFDLRQGQAWQGEPHRGDLHAGLHQDLVHAGLFFYTTSAEPTTLQIERLQRRDADALEATPPLRLLDAEPGPQTLQAGSRWIMRCRPDPFPADPFDPERFRLQATFTDADGRRESVAAFFKQPLQLLDRGDSEDFQPDGAAHFEIRWRPRRPGTYQLQIEASGSSIAARRFAMPAVTVTGPAWDEYIRVDRTDPRFFAIGDPVNAPTRFYWPAAINLRSVNDGRAAKRLNTRLSPDRGWHAYRDYFHRLAAHGVGSVEIWMASWNLALEWREDWPGYRGAGRYNQVNAARLDHILALGEELGISVNLVIYNHGQGSQRVDREWQDHPYNRQLEGRSGNGPPPSPGFLEDPSELWNDARAQIMQAQLRRYLLARYSDYTSVLGWKLWSEQNLTAGSATDRYRWHRSTAQAWKEEDIYQHPITTHWSGDYKTPNRDIVALPGLDYICIDAYHKTYEDPNHSLLDLLWAGTQDPRGGLGRFNKPIVVTEYGGNSSACPEPQLIAEHRAGPWASLVAGYGTGSMLWWYEWVDQGEHFEPYLAVSRFLEGEDLRSEGEQSADTARACGMPAKSHAGELWCRGWYRQGYLLGYLADRRWVNDGSGLGVHRQVSVLVGDQVTAGQLLIEWWDANTGIVLRHDRLEHPGGRLQIDAPDFEHHLAFKLKRQAQPRAPESPDDAL